MRLQDHVEVELKLTVVAEDADAVLDAVARLVRVGSFRLGPPDPHRLYDIYWDLPDRSLRAQHLSLRLRQIDDRLVFTAKGGTCSHRGLFRRNELEVPATPECWLSVRAALESEGAHLGNGRGPSDGVPADWLRAAGLMVTQERTTHRTIRLVYPDATPDAATAELALDRTQFRIGAYTINYREIEIEQLGDEGSPEEIGAALREQFPDAFEFSTMGKYSRGLALERALRENGHL
jgi:inorganic triphosphatase YgiF